MHIFICICACVQTLMCTWRDEFWSNRWRKNIHNKKRGKNYRVFFFLVIFVCVQYYWCDLCNIRYNQIQPIIINIILRVCTKWYFSSSYKTKIRRFCAIIGTIVGEKWFFFSLSFCAVSFYQRKFNMQAYVRW